MFIPAAHDPSEVPPLVEHSDAVWHNPFELGVDVKVQSLQVK
jgi:hypothetical protein